MCCHDVCVCVLVCTCVFLCVMHVCMCKNYNVQCVCHDVYVCVCVCVYVPQRVGGESQGRPGCGVARDPRQKTEVDDAHAACVYVCVWVYGCMYVGR